MLQFTQEALNWVLSHEKELLALAGGGAGLSVALQYILHKFKIDSKKLAYTLIHLLSVLSAFSAYYLNGTNALPVYATLVIVAQTFHRFVVSPYYNKYVIPFLNYLGTKSPSQPVQSLAQPQVANQVEENPGFLTA